MLGAYGDEAAVFGMVDEPDGAFWVSSRVIVSVEGNFPDPLCFRRFVMGPDNPVGDAGLERFRVLRVVEVAVD